MGASAAAAKTHQKEPKLSMAQSRGGCRRRRRRWRVEVWAAADLWELANLLLSLFVLLGSTLSQRRPQTKFKQLAKTTTTTTTTRSKKKGKRKNFYSTRNNFEEVKERTQTRK